jgi:hypothetical protein
MANGFLGMDPLQWPPSTPRQRDIELNQIHDARWNTPDQIAVRRVVRFIIVAVIVTGLTIFSLNVRIYSRPGTSQRRGAGHSLSPSLFQPNSDPTVR